MALIGGASAAAVVAAVTFAAVNDDEQRNPAIEAAATDAATIVPARTTPPVRPSGTSAASATVASAPVAVPTTAAPTTAPATTVAPTTTTVLAGSANSFAGRYNFTRTVIDGNPNFPVGKTDTFSLVLTAKCAGVNCTLSSAGGLGEASFDGTGLSFAGITTTACADAPALTSSDAWEMEFTASAFDANGLVSTLTGTHKITTTVLCPNSESDPVAFTLTATRG